MTPRVQDYLDETERSLLGKVGKSRARALRLELAAHLSESIDEGQQLGLSVEESTERALKNLGTLDPAQLGKQPAGHAKWLIATVFVAWPWAFWLFAKPVPILVQSLSLLLSWPLTSSLAMYVSDISGRSC